MLIILVMQPLGLKYSWIWTMLREVVKVMIPLFPKKKMKWKWVRALYRTMIYMQVNSLYLPLYWEVILIMVWNIAIRSMSRLIGQMKMRELLRLRLMRICRNRSCLRLFSVIQKVQTSGCLIQDCVLKMSVSIILRMAIKWMNKAVHIKIFFHRLR